MREVPRGMGEVLRRIGVFEGGHGRSDKVQCEWGKAQDESETSWRWVSSSSAVTALGQVDHANRQPQRTRPLSLQSSCLSRISTSPVRTLMLGLLERDLFHVRPPREQTESDSQLSIFG